MIEGMVATLDEKLRQNPQDPEGWQRLVRSYAVLGKAELAQDALDRGYAALGRDSEDGKKLVRTGRFARSQGNGVGMTRKQKRLSVIAGALAFLGAATALTFYALGQKASYFYMPADLQAASLQPGQRIRLGGLVEAGSIVRGQGTEVAFGVTDSDKTVKVRYTGILPDLFREGQGVITEGSFGPDGTFIADSVLAKHDENYMPKEVADSLKEKGVWQETAK